MPDAPGAVTTPIRSPFAMTNPNGTNVVFSPGVAIQPQSQQPVRSWDFPVNFNSSIRPRAYGGITFAHLRAFSNVEMVRLAIETRKDQIEGQHWAIKPKDEKSTRNDSRIATLTKFFERPDGVTPLSTFFRVLLEDLLSLDAPCMELRRSRGGKLIGLEYVPGETIVPKVDETGRIPRQPDALAYQQVIKGVVWNNLTRKDILYLPRNVRAGHVYGYGPVEQIVVTINTIMHRQAGQLAHFTAGNIPAGLLNAPEGWQLDKIKELQDWLDDKVSGVAAEQSKILWGPAGSKYQAFKDAPIKDEFDEWLARIVASAFSLPPTPFVRQMNRSTAGEDQERALEEGLGPLKLWFKRWVDTLLADEFGAEDLEFVFIEPKNINLLEQGTIDDRALRNGSTTLDEVRDARGLDPLPDGLGSEPLIYTATGAVRLRDALDTEAQAPVAGTGTPAIPAADGEQVSPANPAPQAEPEATKLAKSAPKLITVNRSKARKTKAAIKKTLAPALVKMGKDVAEQVTAALDGVGKAVTISGAPTDPHRLPVSRIVMGLDLSGFQTIQDALELEIADLAADSSVLAVTTLDGYTASDGIVDRVFDRAVAWAKERAAELVSLHGEDSLVASTRDMLRDTITQGLADNIGTPAIADAIQTSAAFSAERSELIAVTEVAFANENGKMEGWREVQDEGVEIVKAWLTTNDDNCCDECQGNESDGDIPLDDEFSSGDENAPAHPQCQCCTSAHSVEGGNGEEAES